MEKKVVERIRLKQILKSKKFWAGVIAIIALVVISITVYRFVKMEQRQQVADEILSQCERVESVEVDVLIDARNRKRPTYVVKVPADFTEDERDEVKNIVKEHYEKYYYVFFE